MEYWASSTPTLQHSNTPAHPSSRPLVGTFPHPRKSFTYKEKGREQKLAPFKFFDVQLFLAAKPSHRDQQPKPP